MKKQDCSAGGRDVVEEGEEGMVRTLAEIGVRRRRKFGWSGIEGLPAASAFEVGESDTRGDMQGPGAEDGGLAQKWKLAEDLERCLLEDVVGKVGADEAGDVAAQRRMGIAKELF